MSYGIEFLGPIELAISVAISAVLVPPLWVLCGYLKIPRPISLLVLVTPLSAILLLWVMAAIVVLRNRNDSSPSIVASHPDPFT